jgi:hypothetical protein
MGEPATYALKINPEIDIPANTTLEMVFNPEGFSKTLSTIDK